MEVDLDTETSRYNVLPSAFEGSKKSTTRMKANERKQKETKGNKRKNKESMTVNDVFVCNTLMESMQGASSMVGLGSCTEG